MYLEFALLACNKTYGAVGIDKEIIHTHLLFVVAARQQAIFAILNGHWTHIFGIIQGKVKFVD